MIGLLRDAVSALTIAATTALIVALLGVTAEVTAMWRHTQVAASHTHGGTP